MAKITQNYFIAIINKEGISQNFKLHVSVHVQGLVHIVSYGEN